LIVQVQNFQAFFEILIANGAQDFVVVVGGSFEFADAEGISF